MTESSKTVAIGVLTTAAIALVVWVLLFLHPSLGDGKNLVYVRFANIEKIGVGTRVTFAGKPVGAVVSIRLIPKSERTESKTDDNIYTYELGLAYDSKVDLLSTDEITIKTSGLMGERAIAIVPRKIQGQTSRAIKQNEVILADSADGVDEAFAILQTVAKKFEKTMDQVNGLQENFQNTLSSIAATSNELNTLIKKANDENLVGNLSAVVANIRKGDGSLGKLAMNDDFYIKSSAILQKVDVLMNDVNNYGVLFHLDKTWQRERRRHLEEIAKLSTSSDFSNYMNDEVSRISLSISRLSMALNKVDSELEKADHRMIDKTFKELLNQLVELENNIKAMGIDHIADDTNVQNPARNK